MKTECVTKVWEFYRDNCAGYKEPMRKQLRELDEHVDHIAAENAKLRELVRKVLQFERAGCEGCPYASTCDVDCLYESDCPMRKDIEQDIRKLGVDE